MIISRDIQIFLTWDIILKYLKTVLNRIQHVTF